MHVRLAYDSIPLKSTDGRLMTRLLIVDDDTELSQMLSEYLQAEDFAIECAFDGASGVRQALASDYDAVILDVMMPELDGFEVLRRIRSHSDVPVIMLTAKGDDVDRIVGLEIGADDYLPKPFNPRELLARLRAVLRRSRAGQAEDSTQDKNIINVAGLEVHPSSRTAYANGTALNLTSTEYNLLHTLMSQAGAMVTKDALSQRALGRPLQRYDRSLDMHMSNMRNKLAEHGLDSMVLTVRGQGYQLSTEE